MLMSEVRFMTAAFKVTATMVVCAVAVLGCGKKESDEASKTPPPHAPESYMNDKAFRAELKARREAMKGLGAERAKIAARLEEMTKIIREKLGTDDPAKVGAELDKIAEWTRLKERALALDKEFAAAHRETQRIVRERIVPKKTPVSK